MRAQVLVLALLLLLANIAGAIEARPSTLAQTPNCCAMGSSCCAPGACCCAGKRAPAPSTERVAPPSPNFAKLVPCASAMPAAPRLVARRLLRDEVTASPEERRLHLRQAVFLE